MSTSSTVESVSQTAEKPTDMDPFDLDIRFIENGEAAATLINLTDNGCGSTCASPCATNVG
ncbi:FxLD family lanthipeptide [Phytohabitans aurantiacus]|uniref:FxLD family lantipeptide n=1 Tax=Phytohabitans aurantiacus TaxID=3016789 RepID=A0ABQ5R4S4_9ACTN|nr:FxLD family lanthipeptide [Phytohabitans aurantiacus]GLI00935.1 FxLD family lantipeptide [Phytohabitans aurantiacus]